MAEIQLYFHHLIHPVQVELRVYSSLIPIENLEPSIQNYQALDSISARLLRSLGLLGSDRFTTFLATELLEANAESAIAQLIQVQFIQAIAQNYYQITHPTIRSFARSQLGLEEPMSERQAARLRICQAYLKQLESDAARELAWFEQERSNLFALLEWTQQTQAWDVFARLVETIAEFVDECGDYTIAQDLSQLALKNVTDPIHKAMLLNNLANFELRQRSWESAESNYTQSLNIFSQLSQVVRMAQTSVNLGVLAMQQKQWVGAVQHWKTALSQLPADEIELQAIQQRMFSIDPDLLESAGGRFRPANGLFSSLKDKLKRLMFD
jgi:tetratricopeptide (TPR) repeat protein